jgi:tricarballylate dehydrogenase
VSAAPAEAAVDADVAVVGGGNAALCAALSARQAGASVVLLERAPRRERGGNSWFSAGVFRAAYENVSELESVFGDLGDEVRRATDFGAYPKAEFHDDLVRVAESRGDPHLTRLLVEHSLDALRWIREHGVRFVPAYGRQSFAVDGVRRFWGGLVLQTEGAGPGLVDGLYRAAGEAGVEVRYETAAVGLEIDDGRVGGVRCLQGGSLARVRAGAVVVAAGGFEANAEWRARYLGPGWDLAKVRGTRFNTGDGIRMAVDAGAMPWGNWSGCHAVAWDSAAPPFGDFAAGDVHQKHSYQLGIIVNKDGARFFDEGADFRNYTYARLGRLILAQPAQVAWQVFDGKVLDLLRDEYRLPGASRARAETLPELAEQMPGIDVDRFLAEVRTFNDAVQRDRRFDPTSKDGRGTRDLAVPKSNWANPIDQPPFEAHQVTCGITFTFGGLKVDDRSRVLDVAEHPVTGLFAAGELVGGLFYFNYPGGSGLTAGAVLGRIAGREAAAFAAVRRQT